MKRFAVAAAFLALGAGRVQAQPRALAWSSLLGGSGVEDADALVIAPDGGVIIAGTTDSLDLSVTSGAFQSTSAGRRDAFVAGLSPDGDRLNFLTYYGGSGDDVIVDLALDVDGTILAAGHTSSNDLPMAPGALQGQSGGQSEAFVIRLDGSGSSLLASTYLGGPSFDYGEAVRLDEGGSVFVAGEAGPGFPTTAGAYDRTHNGGNDVFVARLLPDLSTAEYVTLLGGSKLDCTDCTLDVTRSGRAVIVSESSSVDLPTSPGAFGPTPNGGSDAYVARLSPDGSALEVGTYLGGTGAECTEGCRVAVDRDGSIWIAGNTSSGDFPGVPVSNPGPLGPRDMFLAHLSADGHNLLLSRRYRGRGVDVARDIAVDDAGDVWVALRTSSDDLQTTADAYDPTYNGRGDIAVLEMDGASGDVRYGTYLGGAGLDGGWLPRVELGSQGRVYAAGQTGSSDFPTTAGAFDTSLSGLDGFALVLGELVPSSPTPTPSATVTPTPSLTPSPSETPTPSLTPSPSDTPTPSPSPTATPLPQPPANVCPQILGRVPSAVIAAALANPEMVSGWDDLCNRNRPGDPSNRRRHWLTLLDPGKPYHPLFNSVVYRCGCP